MALIMAPDRLAVKRGLKHDTEADLHQVSSLGHFQRGLGDADQFLKTVQQCWTIIEIRRRNG